MRDFISAPIEYFLWTKTGGQSEKPDQGNVGAIAQGSQNVSTPESERLVYYDQEGTCFEKDIASHAIDDALKIFDGKIKAVQRRSGGLILAEPYQIVLVESESEESPRPQIRIRVKFLDFKAGKGLVTAPEYLVHTKVVSPEEMKDPFILKTQSNQRYVLDFGQGIVPVHVFHFENSGENNWAYFIEQRDLNRVIKEGAGTKAEVQIYRVPQEVLRFADESEVGSSDFNRANNNYERLKALGGKVVPDCLAWESHIEVPSSSSAHDLRNFLRMTLIRSRRKGTAAEKMRLALEEEVAESIPLNLPGE
jgi:hypothetical protein